MSAPQITKDMRVKEILAYSPQAAEIMTEYGLHCHSCSVGGTETLAEGCAIHKMSDELLDELVDDINQAIADQPERAWELTVTAPAAEGIKKVAEQEGRSTQALRIEIDFRGGFCLEFCDAPEEFDQAFFNAEHPDVKVYASPLALQRIGGAVIDVRDERFKLDLPSDLPSKCCKGSEENCDCKK